MFQKKPGYLFDGVDLCVEEGSKVCILGYNGVGKSSLLRLLAKAEAPTEGTIHHASGISIGYWDADLLKRRVQNHGASTSLKYLQDKYGNRTEQDLRSELTSFGLAPHQITRPIHYLSGGEQTRLALVDLMLNDPPVLLLDNPTCHLDVESVEALTYGLQRWKGTVVMVSHDASFLRVLDVQCYVLTEKEGKLRRLEGGMDMYLKHFKY
uniref:ABC transporter domain-containing protein n=1 Tax=Craspedostauros australis TaxID=1486917 RepID=A0A7S0F5W4_9STRA|mmetsp:Transcript_6433/g.17517  ORF Transcript_6433/g.17517 Transcript_6433/m.17517 type:complete len:209 (+) Transcript_6433:490-1116(+)